MAANTAWLRRHRATAWVAAIALVAAVPVTVATTHRGFPVAHVDLKALDVWVTNGATHAAGRLNKQIGQLDAQVAPPAGTPSVNVLQDGGAYFLTDQAAGTVQRIDPAYVDLTDQMQVPPGARLAYGDNSLAVLTNDQKGSLWVLDASQQLAFDPDSAPAAKLGADAAVAAAKSGRIFAVSPAKSELVEVAGPGASVIRTKLKVDKDASITTVGDTAVVLDRSGQRLRAITGGTVTTLQLPQPGLVLQQSSAGASDVLVSSATGLERVPLSGKPATQLSAGLPAPTKQADAVAPVQVDGCDYAAWSGSDRYLYACDGGKATTQQVASATSADQLEFRVNHGVVALNDLQNGYAWVASKSLRQVDDWSLSKPTATTASTTGPNGVPTVSTETTAATPPKRSAINRTPTPQPDQLGVRPGRTTVLPVLDNDTDPDGDVLTIAQLPAIPSSQGTLSLIEDDRALQYTPPTGATSGGASFRYTVSDGRGGSASAQATVTIYPPSVETAPKQIRSDVVEVEQGQSVTDDVLPGWLDHEGDDIYLQTASSDSGDKVAFTPDGKITFTSTGGKLGNENVDYVVSDGTKTATGTLTVQVKAVGSTSPIAIADYVQAPVGQNTVASPLANDISPSGQALTLSNAPSTSPTLVSTVDSDNGTVTFTPSSVGTSYVPYQLQAGSKTAEGVIRVDATAPDDGDEAPIAVNDVVYAYPGQSTDAQVLDNDVSPSGRVLAVQSVTAGPGAAGVTAQLIGNSVIRVTTAGVLSSQAQLAYTVSDGQKSSVGTLSVVPVQPLTQFLPPVAVDDQVTVRAGDVADVHVLDNDYSPDGQPFTLAPKLVSTAGAGPGASAFVSGSDVRYEAPKTASQRTVTYEITDTHGQSTTAAVHFNVLPAVPAALDNAPQPQDVTARVFQGSSVPVTVPLDGIDPDGDSVYFDGLASAPSLGAATDITGKGFTYQANATATGTDTFSYRVVDALGQTATATVNVAVIARPAQLSAPTGVTDTVQLKPGAPAAVPVLANDSDPNGYPLTLHPALEGDVSKLQASVDGSDILLTAPKKIGAYTLRYTMDNGHGGPGGAALNVVVTPNAAPRYPSAQDQIVSEADAKGKSTVTVDALAGAINPSGTVDQLRVATDGANAGYGVVNGDGTITLTTQPTLTVVGFTVTDPATGLSSDAFALIPPVKGAKAVKPASLNGASRPSNSPADAQHSTSPKPSNAPSTPPASPSTSPSTKQSTAPHSGSSPSNTPTQGASKPTAPAKPTTSSTPGPSSTGAPKTGGSPTPKGTSSSAPGPSNSASPSKTPSGPATSSQSPKPSKSTTPKPSSPATPTKTPTPSPTPTAKPRVTVTDPAQQQVAAGQDTPIDLSAYASDPDPSELAGLTWSKLTQCSTTGVSGTLGGTNGKTLTITVDTDAPIGATATCTYTVTAPDGTTATGHIPIEVASSTLPDAYQEDSPTETIARGTCVTDTNVLGKDRWSNPFPDTPLTLVGDPVSSDPSIASVTAATSNGETDLTFCATTAATIGTTTVTYTVQDKTKDSTRDASGSETVTVDAKPSQMSAPTATCTDAAASVSFAAATANGSAITGYKISWNGGSKTGTPGQANSITGLRNGTAYTFTVTATNGVGTSTASAGASCTPWGTPSTPGNLKITKASTYASSYLNMSWSGVGTASGGTITYHYKLSSNSGWSTTTGTSVRTTNKKPAGTYSFQVYATNSGGKQSGTATSGSLKLANAPVAKNPVVSLSATGSTVTSSCGHGCHYFSISASNFGANHSYPIAYFCNGKNMNYTGNVLVTNSAGSGSWNNSMTAKHHPYCGYANSWVTVNGTKSNTVDFSK